MAVPSLLGIVYCKVNINICIVCPLFDDFVIIEKVVLATGTVNDINLTVTIAVMTAVVDYRTERSKTYTTCNKKEVLTCKLIVNRERLAVRTADCNLLAYLCGVKPLGNSSALLD